MPDPICRSTRTHPSVPPFGRTVPMPDLLNRPQNSLGASTAGGRAAMTGCAVRTRRQHHGLDAEGAPSRHHTMCRSQHRQDLGVGQAYLPVIVLSLKKLLCTERERDDIVISSKYNPRFRVRTAHSVIACCAITSPLAGEYEDSGSVSPGCDQAPAPPQAPGWSAWIARSRRRSGMVLAEVGPDQAAASLRALCSN